MIELVSVELRNFRAFTHGIFQPAANGEGLTAIVGDNGSGKTSIVTGLLWCLYGTTPDGVTVRALRKQNTEEPVIVTTTFIHDNQTVTVERSLRGSQDKTVARIIVDGQSQTEVSSRSATQWIINRTGLNAESFTSAFVVQQKELDSLVKARPAERRKTIERLAGIERMSQAIVLAKEESKTRRTVLSALTPSHVDLDHNLATIKKLTHHNTLLTEQEKETIEEKNTLTRTLDDTTATLHKVRENEALITATENSITVLTTKISSTETLRTQHENVVDAAKKLSPDAELHSVETLEETSDFAAEQLAELEKVAEQHTQEQQRYLLAGQALSTMEKQLEQKETKNSDLQQQNVNVIAELAELPDISDVKHRIQTLTEQQQTLTENAAVLKNDITVNADALTLMRTQHKNVDKGNPRCPTCQNPIPNHEEIIEKFTTKLSEQKKQLTTVEKNIRSRQKDLSEHNTTLNAIVALHNKAREIEHTIGEGRNEILEIEARVAEQSDLYDVSAEKLHALTTEHPNLTEMIRDTKNELANITRLLEVTENAHQAQKKCDEATQKIVELTTEKNTLLTQLETLTSTRENEHTPAMLEQAAQTLRDDITEKTQHITTIEQNITANTHTIEELEKQNTQHLETEKRHAEARLDAETAMTTVAALEAFRKDRLARLTPELSEITTDLLSEMTDGKYVLVEFDDDFTPYITSDTAETRPVTWLSGGEESLVALALRIAVGEILAGGRNGNVLILDEVLTAQDRTRRNATLASIRGLDRQTIVVNHIEESTDVVDKVVYVTAAQTDNPDEGSTLT